MRSFPGRPSAEAAPDVLIIGAGIIGCSVAYYLTLSGHRVLVVDRDQLAAGASHVAPGMLAPQVEAHYDDAFFAMSLAGRALHAPLAAALAESVGLDVECRFTGVLRVAADEAERAELRRRLLWQQRRGLRVEWLEPAELGEREPLLAGASGRQLTGGLWFPDEGQVRAPRLVEALARASALRGARFREGITVTGLAIDGTRATGALTSGNHLPAGSVVLTAGVGSASVARSTGIELPVRPVKGQVIHLHALDRVPAQILWSGHCYLVPRANGEVVLGATEEDGNDDPRPTLAGVGRLASEALELVPTLGGLRVIGVQGGLRPAAPDRFPIIGRVPTLDNLWVATAHFRGGILLGPLTGKVVAEGLDGTPVPRELAAFGVDRFVPDSRSESP